MNQIYSNYLDNDKSPSSKMYDKVAHKTRKSLINSNQHAVGSFLRKFKLVMFTQTRIFIFPTYNIKIQTHKGEKA